MKCWRHIDGKYKNKSFYSDSLFFRYMNMNANIMVYLKISLKFGTSACFEKGKKVAVQCLYSFSSARVMLRMKLEVEGTLDYRGLFAS